MKKKIYLVIGAAILTAIGVLPFLLNAAEDDNTSLSVGTRYLKALRDGDIKAAYNLTSQAFKYAIPESDFRRCLVGIRKLLIEMENEKDVDKDLLVKFKEAMKENYEILYIDDVAYKINENRSALLFVQRSPEYPLNLISDKDEAKKIRDRYVKELSDELARARANKNIKKEAMAVFESAVMDFEKEKSFRFPSIAYLQIWRNYNSGKWEVCPNFNWTGKRDASLDLNLRKDAGTVNLNHSFRDCPSRYEKDIRKISYWNLCILETNPPECSKCGNQLFDNWAYCPKCGTKTSDDNADKK
ncbi:MAG: zinc ribbon domain-containing protein [Planctomycetes bacterium]|nr:zinc ribbon domain-containing protein [Planctomycetota bacterium]